MEEMEFEYPIIRRIIAHLIDIVLALILLFTILMLTGFANLFEVLLIFTVLVALYYVLFEASKYRGTLGKLWMGIELVDTNGSTVFWWVSLGRIFFPSILGVVLRFIGYSNFDSPIINGLSILGVLFLYGSFFTIFFNKKRRTLWDMMFGTCVIRVKRQ